MVPGRQSGRGSANPAGLCSRRAQVALCLGSAQPADPAAWAWEARSQRIQPLCAREAHRAALGLSLSGGRGALGLNHAALGSEVLGLWVEQPASAPDALPPEVSGVGAPPGFHVWAPSLLICVRTTGPQVNAFCGHQGQEVTDSFMENGVRALGD